MPVEKGYERLKRVERNKDVKPGDKIRIVDATGADDLYENGDILTVLVGAGQGRFADGNYVRSKEVRPLIFLYEFEKLGEIKNEASYKLEKRVTALEEHARSVEKTLDDLKSAVYNAGDNEPESDGTEFSANDARAEVIRKAQSYILSVGHRLLHEGYKYDKNGMVMSRECKIEYETVTDSRAVFVAIRDAETAAVYAVGSSMSAPGDVFNEHIEKARAIDVALEVVNDEFTNVPQPNIVVEGMEVRYRANDGRILVGEATDTGDPYLTEVSVLNDPDRDILVEILVDTSAVYD